MYKVIYQTGLVKELEPEELNQPKYRNKPPKDACVLKGKYLIRLYDEKGCLKDERAGYNVIVDDGKSFVAAFLNSAAAGAATFTMKYVGIGTGTTAESSSQTALVTEVARTTATASNISGAIYQLTATFAAGTGTGAITEYGIFSSSSAGTMLSRDLENVINKGASDTLTVTAQITFS